MQKTAKPVKVLLLVEDLNTGGLERVVETIYNGLDPGLFALRLWCLARGGDIASRLTKTGRDIKILGLTNYYNPVSLIRLCRLIKRERFKIVHTHGYFSGVMGRVAAFMARTPVIVSHVHTTGNLKARNIKLEQLLAGVTDRVVCCSESVKSFLKNEVQIPEAKLKVVYNGVPGKKPADGDPKPDEHRSGPVRITIVASLVENKGHRYLFEAVGRLYEKEKRIRLTVVGEGPLRRELKVRAKRLGINDLVEFTGMVDNVHEMLSRSHIVVLPSVKREGLGISLIEAMGHGLPLLGSRVGGIPEVIVHGENGYLVSPGDADALAGKLGELVQDQSLRERMGAQGRKRFEKYFQAKGMLKHIRVLYETLLHEAGSDMVNILYLHNQTNIGGGERSLINLWKRLDARKYRSHLIIPGKGLLDKEAKQAGLSVQFRRVPKLRPVNLPGIIKALAALMFYCFRRNIDLIHSYTPRNNILSSLAGAMIRIPVVWHERNLIYDDKQDVSRRFMGLPDSIICNSKAIAERFRKNDRIPDKIRTVLNGVDVERFRPGNKESGMLNQYRLEGNRVVGLVSSLDKRKRPEYIIEAAPKILKECPDTLFMIVGGEFGPDAAGRKTELENLAAASGISSRVILTGFLEEVPQVIRLFDLGAAVTEKEACSRAILEMMATGKPVVAFDTGGNSELVEHGETGYLVKMGDVEKLAWAVIKLLKNDKQRKEMGDKARTRAKNMFDVRLNARKTQAIYDELLK